jgi:hypothetical protein
MEVSIRQFLRVYRGDMIKLLGAFKTVAFLADAGCYEEAFKLLYVLDQIAMGIEQYHEPLYQCTRKVLLAYITSCINDPGDWHSIG